MDYPITGGLFMSKYQKPFKLKFAKLAQQESFEVLASWIHLLLKQKVKNNWARTHYSATGFPSNSISPTCSIAFNVDLSAILLFFK